MSVIVFDVNETLSDMAPLAQRFSDVGAPASLAATWFAATLRDGNALTMAATPRPFADVARAVLHSMWAGCPQLDRTPDEAADHVLDGFTSLSVHPDVVPGVTALAEAGHRLVTLSNGATSVAEGLLSRAGIRDAFAAVLSVDDAGAWKPDPRAYHYAARICGVAPTELVLVAVHPWDVHGATAAGLRGAYVDRSGAAPWPEVFTPPALRVRTIEELAPLL